MVISNLALVMNYIPEVIILIIKVIIIIIIIIMIIIIITAKPVVCDSVAQP